MDSAPPRPPASPRASPSLRVVEKVVSRSFPSVAASYTNSARSIHVSWNTTSRPGAPYVPRASRHTQMPSPKKRSGRSVCAREVYRPPSRDTRRRKLSPFMPVASYSVPSGVHVSPCVKAPASCGCVATSSHDRGSVATGVSGSHASGPAAAAAWDGDEGGGVPEGEPLPVAEPVAAADPEDEADGDNDDDGCGGSEDAAATSATFARAEGDGDRDAAREAAAAGAPDAAADARPSSSPTPRPHVLSRPPPSKPMAAAHTAAHCHDRSDAARGGGAASAGEAPASAPAVLSSCVHRPRCAPRLGGMWAAGRLRM